MRDATSTDDDQEPAGDDGPTGGRTDAGEVSVLCRVDVEEHGLAVEWTDGALFHFDSVAAAERWVQRQNERVRGNLHLKTDTPGSDVLDPDRYLHYRPPTR
jgi:hypothetical protein